MWARAGLEVIMRLTPDQRSRNGFVVRENNSGRKELEVCVRFGLDQKGGSQTKVDGTDGVRNFSIKIFNGSSTQVHLTTQKAFLDQFDANDDVREFLGMFCGTQDRFDADGKDRFTSTEIKESYPEIYDAFESFLNKNKIAIIQYIISNKSDITHVLIRNPKKRIEYVLTTAEIYDKVNKECYWEILPGGIHLRNKSGKSLFHFQREGKKGGNPNKIRGYHKKFKNRFNVLWHIHYHVGEDSRNLFI